MEQEIIINKKRDEAKHMRRNVVIKYSTAYSVSRWWYTPREYVIFFLSLFVSVCVRVFTYLCIVLYFYQMLADRL